MNVEHKSRPALGLTAGIPPSPPPSKIATTCACNDLLHVGGSRSNGHMVDEESFERLRSLWSTQSKEKKKKKKKKKIKKKKKKKRKEKKRKEKKKRRRRRRRRRKKEKNWIKPGYFRREGERIENSWKSLRGVSLIRVNKEIWKKKWSCNSWSRFQSIFSRDSRRFGERIFAGKIKKCLRRQTISRWKQDRCNKSE